MKNKTSARKHSSKLLKELLSELTPIEKMQTSTKMALAARIEDLISARGWGKREFAEKVNKNPSEITKWLSGTQNFTIDTLSEIAITLGMSISELFAQKQNQIINKVHVVISSKTLVPSIKYYTPFDNNVSELFRYNPDSYRNMMTSLVSN
jgi:transcriptional regulator with XRE-family HTH domain